MLVDRLGKGVTTREKRVVSRCFAEISIDETSRDVELKTISDS